MPLSYMYKTVIKHTPINRHEQLYPSTPTKGTGEFKTGNSPLLLHSHHTLIPLPQLEIKCLTA